VELPPIERAEDLGAAFTRADRRNAGALIPFVDATMIGAAREVVQLAIEHRLPTAFDFRGFVEVGGLLSYQGNTQELIRHAARYTDMILKGSSPGELPIVQPTKFELIVNLKTAKALGLTIPPSILLRADRVIE